jgi:ParB-like chromosome segregation protein Spo0J
MGKTTKETSQNDAKPTQERVQIRVACDVKDHLPLSEFTGLQGDLKHLEPTDAAKLRREILDTGFAFPIYVWKQRGKNYVLGGHQRLRVLRDLEAEGAEVPPIPVVHVKAKNLEEAKRRVLQDVAQYGRVTEEGLHGFVKEMDMGLLELGERFTIPEIDMAHLEANYFPESQVFGNEQVSSLILGNPNERVPLDTLKPHPRNYRKYPPDQVQHIAATVMEIGIYKHLIVAADYTILSGHGIYEAARHLGLKSLPIKKLKYDKDDIRALKILLNDSDLGHLAEVDDRVLSEILKYVKENSPTGLSGTGYDEKMLAALVMVTRPASEIANIDEAKEWVGMPEYENTKEPFKVIVACADEETRKQFLDHIEAKTIKGGVSNKVVSIWWPDKGGRDDQSSLKFAQEGASA